MFLRTPAALLVTTLCLTACASFDGLRSEGRIIDPASLQSEQTFAGTLSPAHWPTTDWWAHFDDRQLNELVAEALASSPDLQIADARARQASAAVLAADAARQVNVSGHAGITRSRSARVDDPTGQGALYGTLRTLSVDASYTFDLWGGQRATWEAALGRVRASEVDRQGARLKLATDVVRAYNDLGLAYANQDIAEQDLKRARDLLRLGNDRVDAGLDSTYQLQQTRSIEATAEATLTAARQAVQQGRIRLATLLGKGPDRGESLQRPRLVTLADANLPAQVPADLLGRRPDLVAARWRVEAASKDIDASKAAFYPNLNLTAAAGTQSLLGDALFGGASRFFNIGPALSLPLFDGGRLRAGLAGHDADYDLAVAQYNQTLVTALGDVGDSITRIRALEQQVEQQRRALDIAHNAYDLAAQRYGDGIGNYLDVLSVEQQLLQAERELASIGAQRIDAQALLMQALGGGFENTTGEPATAAASKEN